MERKKKKRRGLIAIVIIVLILILWIVIGNKALELNAYVISGNKVPEAFQDYRIAQVSDLHNAQMGKDNEKLIQKLESADPDIIVITGDLIDSRRTDVDVATSFIEKALEIAPCYYVTGNHEARVAEYAELKEAMLELGVTVLEDEAIKVSQNGETVVLLGVDDPSFTTDYLFGDAESVMDNTLNQLATDEQVYTILLSHRPELFSVYVDNDIDLVFSGHAHGGQYRLPILGGLVAPNQGLFPEYDCGCYVENNTTMIVSRGIGNSILPFRVNNPPEIIVVELIHEN